MRVLGFLFRVGLLSSLAIKRHARIDFENTRMSSKVELFSNKGGLRICLRTLLIFFDGLQRGFQPLVGSQLDL